MNLVTHCLLFQYIGTQKSHSVYLNRERYIIYLDIIFIKLSHAVFHKTLS